MGRRRDIYHHEGHEDHEGWDWPIAYVDLRALRVLRGVILSVLAGGLGPDCSQIMEFLGPQECLRNDSKITSVF